MLEKNKIHLGNNLDLIKQLDNDSVDCVFTSPPYWNQRDYGTENVTYLGEPTCNHNWKKSTVKGIKGGANPKVAIKGHENFLDVPDREIEICDYCGAIKTEHGREKTYYQWLQIENQLFEEIYRVLKPTGVCFVNLGDKRAGSGGFKVDGIDNGSLCGIPERFMINMIDMGWNCRSVMIWTKPNGFPQSCETRSTDNYEFIFMFTKSIDYFYNQQKIELLCPNAKNIKFGGEKYANVGGTYSGNLYDAAEHSDGKNMRSVFCFPSENGICFELTVRGNKTIHLAAFPLELAMLFVDAGCPEGGVVLDPFNGTGTTCVAAKLQNKNYIGFEINPDYIPIAEYRIEHDAPTKESFLEL